MTKQQAWGVYLRGTLIATVLYDDYVTDAEAIRQGLIFHDGYDKAIVVRRVN